MAIANIFQFPFSVSWKSFKYLGMSIFLHSLPVEAWKVIFQKIKEKIVSWGALWLNPVGRLVLVKYVLSMLLFFNSPLFWLQQVSKNLYPKKFINFFGKGEKLNLKRFHLVNWFLVRSPKEHGGLGVHGT
jgi:hypothetical protein